jgi:hypothetical protein
MHIFKSRNPIWLLIDIIITVWLWKIPVIIGALFFTFDSVIQLIYTILPDMVDSWDKSKKYRAFYALFLLAGLYFIFRYLIAEKIV